MLYFNDNITIIDGQTTRFIFNVALNEELRYEIENVGADPDNAQYMLKIQTATYDQSNGTWTLGTEHTWSSTIPETNFTFNLNGNSNALARDYRVDLEVLVGQRYYKVARMYGKMKVLDDYFREGAT